MSKDKDERYSDFIDYILENIRDEQELVNWQIEKAKRRNESSVHDSTEQSQNAKKAS